MKTGDKVVCIDDSNQDPSLPCVVKGDVYTIRLIEPDGWCRLFEFPDTPSVWPSFTIDSFRPVVDIGDEVEQYISEKVDQMIEV